MGKSGKPRGVRRTRNPELGTSGVRRYGAVRQNQRKATYKFSKKGLGKSTPHKVPVRADKTEGRFYAADDTKVPLRNNKAKAKPVALRKSIRNGTVVILLAGQFRGKRVIVLKQLKPSGLLLVTGPFAINGVPLRRVNQAYVIATSTVVDVSKIDVSKIDDKFFSRKARTPAVASSKDGEAFFDKSAHKTPVSAIRKSETALVDAALKAVIKATPNLKHYLHAKFTLTKGQRPHLLKF